MFEDCYHLTHIGQRGRWGGLEDLWDVCIRSKLSFSRQSIQQFCFGLSDTFARWVVTTRKIIYHRNVFIARYSWVASWSWEVPHSFDSVIRIMAIFTMTMMAMHNAVHLTRNPACSSFLSFLLYSQLVLWIQQLFNHIRESERGQVCKWCSLQDDQDMTSMDNIL